MKCRICGKGKLHARVCIINTSICTNVVRKLVKYSVCDLCGSESANTKQLNWNIGYD